MSHKIGIVESIVNAQCGSKCEHAHCIYCSSMLMGEFGVNFTQTHSQHKHTYTRSIHSSRCVEFAHICCYMHIAVCVYAACILARTRVHIVLYT